MYDYIRSVPRSLVLPSPLNQSDGRTEIPFARSPTIATLSPVMTTHSGLFLRYATFIEFHKEDANLGRIGARIETDDMKE